MTILTPGQSLRSRIALQTRKGRDVENLQSLDMPIASQREVEEHKRRHPNVKFRTGAVPVYNCHGMTFASRRTAICDPDALASILEDDRYDEVPQGECEPGDVVLYRSGRGEIIHSGIVVDVPDQTPPIPSVWSKWGFGAEVIHSLYDCPYVRGRITYHRIHS